VPEFEEGNQFDNLINRLNEISLIHKQQWDRASAFEVMFHCIFKSSNTPHSWYALGEGVKIIQLLTNTLTVRNVFQSLFWYSQQKSKVYTKLLFENIKCSVDFGIKVYVKQDQQLYSVVMVPV
jgi:hypothetical protein